MWQAIAGAVGGLMGGIGSAKQQRQQNSYINAAASRLNPENIYQNAGILNPWLMGALQGDQSMATGGYGQSLYNIAQNPGYIDPALMNMPFNLSAQRANQDMSRAESILGRTLGGTGVAGLGNAYALANQASRTARDVGTSQQYALWREQQRRSDLAMLNNMLQGLYGQTSQNAGMQSNLLAQKVAPVNAWQIGSNMISSSLSAMSPFGGKGGQQMPMAQPATPVPYGGQGSLSVQPANTGFVPGSYTNQLYGMGLLGSPSGQY